MNFQPSDRRGISRVIIPQVGTYGWQVRLMRRGEKFSRLFSDKMFENAEASYYAALHWRNEILTTWQKEEQVRTCAKSPRNASGMIGVSKITVRSSKGIEYFFWQATWSPATGQTKTIRFSIKRYGDQEAYHLAVQARLEAIAKRQS